MVALKYKTVYALSLKSGCTAALAEATRLLQEALRTQKEPSTVLNSRIWKMAGQVLMDNPDCPVEVSKAVHALMGISLPEVPMGSPVSQANSRQARTAQALQGVSLAAQESLAGMTASGQQLQQSSAYDEQAEAQRMQQEATQLLSTALATINSHCQSPLLQAGGPDHQVVGAMMAPIVLQLAESNRTVRRANAWMSNAAHSMDKSESFHALLAVAMVTQSQQLYGLARYQAASARARLTSAPAAGTEAGLKVPVTSPVRRKAAQDTRAEKRAFQQTQNRQQHVTNMPGAAQPAAAPSSNAGMQQTQGAADVLLMNMSGGIAIVYPGHNGEPYWTEWMGM